MSSEEKLNEYELMTQDKKPGRVPQRQLKNFKPKAFCYVENNRILPSRQEIGRLFTHILHTYYTHIAGTPFWDYRHEYALDF